MIRTGIIIFVLATIAILSWRFKQTETLDATTAAEPTRQADFFLENFHLRQYGETGQLRYQINGQRLEHFPADDSTLISQPLMHLHNNNGSSWRITAAHAQANSEELDEIRLRGNVEITGDATGGNSSMQVMTSSLLLKPKTELAQSEAPITLTQPGAKLVAQSLKADLKNGRFELRNVQGYYEP